MADLSALIGGEAPAALVEVAAVEGSAPREAGAWMVVTADAFAGTIGGGQLEYLAIDQARRMLRRKVRRSGWSCRSAPISDSAAAGG
jgi:xanthine dehydrogenase accessory factor